MSQPADRFETWRLLRLTRSNPPALARGDKKRRAVYVAALEQAEQLFRGAEQLGTATRPLMIFYGLTQAARALGAASIRSEPAWQLAGHGLSQNQSVQAGSVSGLVLLKQKGALTEVARILKSPAPPDNVELGDLLASLPFTVQGSSWRDRPGPLYLQHQPLGSAVYLVMSDQVLTLAGPFPRAVAVGDSPVHAGAAEQTNGIDQQRARIAAHLTAHYPSLADAQPLPEGHLAIRPTAAPEYAPGDDFALILGHRAPKTYGGEGQRQAFADAFGFPYADGVRILPPRLSGNEEPCHPLVTWWAVLFGLSILARYEPALWSDSIDVNASADAVALEEILAYSLDRVPHLLLRAIRDAI